MADKNKSGSGITKIANTLKDNIGKLYQGTYFTQPTNARDLAGIKKDITASINAISTNNVDTAGVANISALYSKITALNKDEGFKKRLEDVFSDKANMDNIMQAYMDNKYLQDLDKEIDVVCKYMPKLEEALGTRKDNVLSADHFSKDFITTTNTTTINNNTFAERIQTIKEKYDLLTEADTWYDNTAKYGEQFIYIVPYKRALVRLKNLTGGITMNMVNSNENGKISIRENVDFDRAFQAANDNVSVNTGSVKVEINNSGILNESVLHRAKAIRHLKVVSEQSLVLEHARIVEEAAFIEAAEKEKVIGFQDIEGKAGKTNEDEVLVGKKLKFSNIIDNDIEIKGSDNDNFMSSDGFVDPTRNKGEITDKQLKVPGCIIKKLPRHLVKPIYMEDICIGYYYIELRKGEEVNFAQNGSILDPTMNMAKNRVQNQAMNSEKQDSVLKQMAAQISGFIDTKFMNDNIDISKEIYMILKYNELYNSPSTTMRITFIPPEDMIHIKFREDPITHRGISDLDKALFPAKLYACLYITNALAMMTRSYDKRVYYVRQTIDNNIAKTLLTTINQIKKSNFGIRQIENINNVLNISGAFNDYLIPTNSSNDPPINFEIMPGQQVNTPMELLEMLQEMAVNTTDVPIELINARQSMDYAVQYTMTNSKFLRKVYSRQGVYERYLSAVVTMLYNYEYDANDTITVKLPPPVFLNITNTSQIIQNTSEFAEHIVNIRMATETNEKVKAEYGKEVKEYYLGSYLDISQLDRLEERARQRAALGPADQ